MATKRFGRLQRTATIVPLALLSAAWTASIAGVGVTTQVVAAEQTTNTTLPDGTSVPTEAIKAPASVSAPDDISAGGKGNTQQIVANSSTNGIPSSALAAYQRAETVINSADKSCNLTWQLVAAIGRVESNHGRFGGNALDDKGVARPGIYGLALNGKNNTSEIRDTDAGQYDNDGVFDRAVGPMQFIPSTWSVVGVDADNDGQRNPQDVDDAALATAVYLCSGNDDLSTTGGQRGAVYRYNHSQSYVDLVLSIMESYLEGDYSSLPNNTTAGGNILPTPPSSDPGPSGLPPSNPGTTTEPELEGDPEPETDEGTDPEGPAPENPGPTNPGTNPGGNPGGNQGPLPEVNVPSPPSTGNDEVDEVLTRAQAILQCTQDLPPLTLPTSARFQKCVDDYMNP